MAYPVILSRRIPYDIDGTKVCVLSSNNVFYGWLSDALIIKMNTYLIDKFACIIPTGGNHLNYDICFFFPEKREIEYINGSSFRQNGYYVNYAFLSVRGSNDTTNGYDGTWETASLPNGYPTVDSNTSWRTGVKPISFTEAKKVVKVQITTGERTNQNGVYYVHFYGRKALGETPDDILVCNTNGNELTALVEWGDRPEGTTVIKSFKIKNASIDKIANNVNLQLNHEDFLMSFSQDGPWQATLDISSIPANSLSAEIFVKNQLGPPLLVLGPKAARVIASVGSWT